jgi:hypothetical protein
MGIQPAMAINKNRKGSRTLGISIAHYYELRGDGWQSVQIQADPVFGPYDRAIKRRGNARQGFQEFHSARRTIQGYEAINMLRKGQVRWMSGTDVRGQNQFVDRVFGLAA